MKIEKGKCYVSAMPNEHDQKMAVIATKDSNEGERFEGTVLISTMIATDFGKLSVGTNSNKFLKESFVKAPWRTIRLEE